MNSKSLVSVPNILQEQTTFWDCNYLLPFRVDLIYGSCFWPQVFLSLTRFTLNETLKFAPETMRCATKYPCKSLQNQIFGAIKSHKPCISRCFHADSPALFLTAPPGVSVAFPSRFRRRLVVVRSLSSFAATVEVDLSKSLSFSPRSYEAAGCPWLYMGTKCTIYNIYIYKWVYNYSIDFRHRFLYVI